MSSCCPTEQFGLIRDYLGELVPEKVGHAPPKKASLRASSLNLGPRAVTSQQNPPQSASGITGERLKVIKHGSSTFQILQNLAAVPLRGWDGLYRMLQKLPELISWLPAGFCRKNPNSCFTWGKPTTQLLFLQAPDSAFLSPRCFVDLCRETGRE